MGAAQQSSINRASSYDLILSYIPDSVDTGPSIGLFVICPRMSSSSATPESWISSFCSLLGHEYFAEVSEEFIEDDFNLTGLQGQVPMYKEALEVGSQLHHLYGLP